MIVAHHLDEISYDKNSVVTVGTFDGVHEGHRAIIGEVVERAVRRDGRSVVVTFDPHPRQVLKNHRGSIELLSTLEERQSLCAQLGVDLFFVIQFTYEFSRQSFSDFYKKYLIDGTGVGEVIEGYDHHFGRDREGNLEGLLQLGKEFSFDVHAIRPISIDGEIVSSSRIRELLREGNVRVASRLLGQSYGFRGVVKRGDARGALLGYPTANLDLVCKAKLVPRNGIYIVQVLLGERLLYGMASIGVRPTFEENGSRIIEVHILDFNRDIYGEVLEVRFLHRLRDENKYETPAALIQQMHLDKEETLKFISSMRLSK